VRHLFVGLEAGLSAGEEYLHQDSEQGLEWGDENIRQVLCKLLEGFR